MPSHSISLNYSRRILVDFLHRFPSREGALSHPEFSVMVRALGIVGEADPHFYDLCRDFFSFDSTLDSQLTNAGLEKTPLADRRWAARFAPDVETFRGDSGANPISIVKRDLGLIPAMVEDVKKILGDETLFTNELLVDEKRERLFQLLYRDVNEAHFFEIVEYVTALTPLTEDDFEQTVLSRLTLWPSHRLSFRQSVLRASAMNSMHAFRLPDGTHAVRIDNSGTRQTSEFINLSKILSTLGFDPSKGGVANPTFFLPESEASEMRYFQASFDDGTLTLEQENGMPLTEQELLSSLSKAAKEPVIQQVKRVVVKGVKDFAFAVSGLVNDDLERTLNGDGGSTARSVSGVVTSEMPGVAGLDQPGPVGRKGGDGAINSAGNLALWPEADILSDELRGMPKHLFHIVGAEVLSAPQSVSFKIVGTTETSDDGSAPRSELPQASIDRPSLHVFGLTHPSGLSRSVLTSGLFRVVK